MKRFLRLLHGCSPEDFKPLLSPQLRDDRVLRFMPEEKAVYLSCSSEVPWPILWFAARYGPKHILDMNKKPSMRKVAECLETFKRKLLWRWFFLTNSSAPSPLEHLKVKRATRKFGGLYPPELGAWCDGLCREVKKQVTIARLKDDLVSNTPRLTTFALKVLKSSEWRIMKNDKEGGWAVLKESQLVEVHKKLLSSACYCPIAWNDERSQSIIAWHSKVALDVVQLELNRLDGIESMSEDEIKESRRLMKQSLNKSLRDSKIRAKVLPLCKSHKDEGEVSVRAVHSLPGFAFESLARWLICEIRKITAGLPHLIKHSAQVVESLSDFKEDGWFFVKMDIKDFYVIGQRDWLAKRLSEAFPEDLRDVVYRVTRFLVFNQFVYSDVLDESFEVSTGFGIGMIHAGDCADLLFHHLAERHFVNRLAAFGIARYFRFRDDSLMIARSGSNRGLGAKALVSAMRVNAEQFELKTEEVSTVGVKYLDLHLTKLQSGAISCAPVYKDPGLARRLGPDSFHHNNVHRSWPRMLLQRARRLSSSQDIFLEYLDLLRSELVPLGIRLPEADSLVRVRAAQSSKVIRLVLPFHRRTCKLIQKAVSQFDSDHSWRAVLSLGCRELADFSVSCAWKNTCAPVVNLLR